MNANLEAVYKQAFNILIEGLTRQGSICFFIR